MCVPFVSLRNVLILLPPSEGKSAALEGPAVDLSALSFPALTATRTAVLTALVDMCQQFEQPARTVRAYDE